MVGKHEQSEQVRPERLHPVDRNVPLPGFGIFREEHPGRDIRAAVEFVVGRKRKKISDVDLAGLDVFEKRRVRNFLRRDPYFLPQPHLPQKLLRRHPHRFGVPLPPASDIRRHRHRRPVGGLEQHRRFPVELMRKRRQLMLQPDGVSHPPEPAPGLEMFEPAPKIVYQNVYPPILTPKLILTPRQCPVKTRPGIPRVFRCAPGELFRPAGGVSRGITR